MTKESWSKSEPHANTVPARQAEPPIEIQETGAKVIGYLGGRNSLERPLSDVGLLNYIQSDTRLSDAMAEGAVIGVDDKKAGR